MNTYDFETIITLLGNYEVILRDKADTFGGMMSDAIEDKDFESATKYSKRYDINRIERQRIRMSINAIESYLERSKTDAKKQ